MTAAPPGCIWLSSGQQHNVDYLFDVAAGRVRRKMVLPGTGGTTAGVGRRCGRRFVAVYVAPDRDVLVLQVDARRFELDGETRVTHRRRFGGLLSELKISRPSAPDLLVRQATLAPAILRRTDPAYDDLDESLDDFLADVADIVDSEERRDWILKIKDPTAGPWELV